MEAAEPIDLDLRRSEHRERLAKMIGLLGSDKAGEASAALAAIGRVMAGTGMDWNWIAGLVRSAAEPGDKRDKLLARLVNERIAAAAPYRYAMRDGEARFIDETAAMLRDNVSAATTGRLERALTIAEAAIRVARGPR